MQKIKLLKYVKKFEIVLELKIKIKFDYGNPNQVYF